MDDPRKHQGYDALAHGHTPQCRGADNDAYDADGAPNGSCLRANKPGVNLSAIAKNWALG